MISMAISYILLKYCIIVKNVIFVVNLQLVTAPYRKIFYTRMNHFEFENASELTLTFLKHFLSLNVVPCVIENITLHLMNFFFLTVS
jgi:hypothetical protein